jgi:hypothetical protein
VPGRLGAGLHASQGEQRLDRPVRPPALTSATTAAELLCSLVIGTVVGLYPALRAASLPPTEALRAM